MADLKERGSTSHELEAVAEALAKLVSQLSATSDHVATLVKESTAREGDDEDARDAAEAAAVMARVRAGEIETFPDSIVGRLLDGDNPVRVFREYRGIKTDDLAKTVGISRPYLSLIETGKREPMFNVMAKIARALDVSLDLLAPAPDA